MKLGRRLGARLLGGAAVATTLVTIGLPVSHEGLSAAVDDASGSLGSGAMVLSATANGSTCATSTSTIATNSNTNCPSTIFPLAIGGSLQSETTTIVNTGTLAASSVQLVSSACGVLTAADGSSTGTNGAVLTGGVQTATSAPFSGSTSLAFDGSTGYLQTQTGYANPQTYTVAVWFKTGSGSSGGGGLMSFDTSQSDASPAELDRMLWVSSSGNVVFGIYDQATDELTSPGSYNDGGWHLAVATMSASGSALYVDGALVASNSAYSAAEDYVGWWHLGWADAVQWTSPPNQNFFNGDIADAAVFPTALSAAAISTLYGEGTQAAESSAILADSPSSYWPLTAVASSTAGQLQPYNGTGVDLGGNGNTVYDGGGVSTAASAPFSGEQSMQLDGSSGYLQTAVSQSGPQTFTIAAWFKAAAGAQGTIVGFTNSEYDSSATDNDRDIWLDSSGQLVAGVDDAGTQDEAVSSSAYTNGSWHLVVATLSASAGLKLYVDGSLVATNAAATAAQSYTGYWHVGWGYGGSGWSNAPSSSYFSGDVSNVAIFPSALSATQVSTLDSQTTQSGEQSAVTADSPSYYWPLVPVQSVTYCQGESVNTSLENDTVSGSPQCWDPYQAGACPVPSSESIATLAGETIPLPNIAPGGDLVLKLTIGDPSNAYSGMRFSIPITFSAKAGSFSASLKFPGTATSQTFTA